MMIKRMLLIFLCYLLFLLILFVFQRKLIYFPEKYSIEQQQVLAERLNLKLWPSKDNYLVQVKGLVLVAPFDSLANVAQHYYWFFLAKWLVRDEFNNIKNLQNYQGSIAILLADEDEIIPNKYSLTLFDSLYNRKRLWFFKDAGHNSLPLAPELPWWQEVMQFVAGQSGVSR
jgi:hypothetical protein